MLKLATAVLLVSLAVSPLFAAEDLTGEFKARVNPAPDAAICFEQTPGTCGTDGFVSAIVSQKSLTGVVCGTYTAGTPNNRTADEFMCNGPTIDKATWLGTYFGAGWNPAECPALGAAATFNLIFTLGGTPCPDDLFIICADENVTPLATDLGDNDWAYEACFACPLGVPPGAPVYFTPQINENAYPQWGWTESADNLVGGFPCLIAPGFGLNDWVPVADATGGPWCGQAFTIGDCGLVTPVQSSTWGVIKSTFDK